MIKFLRATCNQEVTDCSAISRADFLPFHEAYLEHVTFTAIIHRNVLVSIFSRHNRRGWSIEAIRHLIAYEDRLHLSHRRIERVDALANEDGLVRRSVSLNRSQPILFLLLELYKID